MTNIIGQTSNPLSAYTRIGTQGMTAGLNRELLRSEVDGGLFRQGYGFFSYNRAYMPDSPAWAQFVNSGKAGLYNQAQRGALQLNSDIPAPLG